MELLGKYRNGNYNVYIYDDGTKIRLNNLDHFSPEFPECMDVKITNQCDMDCVFCHEDSGSTGYHGILQADFFETLHPFTELAIGGGNPLSHPHLLRFLEELKSKNILASITVNQLHFIKNQDLIEKLVSEKLIWGLGISFVKYTPEFVTLVKKYPNAVLHIINGVVDQKELEKLYNENLKILILGYKEFRRGEKYYSVHVEEKKNVMFENLGTILKMFLVVSFDNLAIKQLDVKRFFSDEGWKEFYMGDDGDYTMYIDLVKREFAKNSTSVRRYDLLPNIVDMFSVVNSNKKK